MTEANASLAIMTPAAFKALYLAHAGELCGYLTKTLRGDRAEAEGIVQEAFLKAWEKRETLRDRAAARAWLYTIAINTLRQRKRKLRPVAVEEISAACERPLPEQHAEDNETLARVRQGLDQLPEDQRQAIVLVRLQSLKFREAAEVLGVPEATVKTRVRRGLLKLTELLES